MIKIVYDIVIKGFWDFYKEDAFSAIVLATLALAKPVIGIISQITGLDLAQVQGFLFTNFVATLITSLFAASLSRVAMKEKWKQVAAAIIINTYMLPFILEYFGFEFNLFWSSISGFCGYFFIKGIISVGQYFESDIPKAIADAIKERIGNFGKPKKEEE